MIICSCCFMTYGDMIDEIKNGMNFKKCMNMIAKLWHVISAPFHTFFEFRSTSITSIGPQCQMAEVPATLAIPKGFYGSVCKG